MNSYLVSSFSHLFHAWITKHDFKMKLSSTDIAVLVTWHKNIFKSLCTFINLDLFLLNIGSPLYKLASKCTYSCIL